MSRQHNQLCSRRSSNDYSELMVRCVSPRVNDPKELHTLVLFSLRNLFGDFEPHSSGMIVEFCNTKDDRSATDTGQTVDICRDDDEQCFAIRCCTKSVSAIRASLTIVTPPPFLEDALYQFDVLKVYSLPRSKQR